MKITINTKHDITFKVRAYIEQEGGMTIEEYPKPFETIQEAIILLEQAQNENKMHNGNNDWVIVCEVKTTRNEFSL